MTHGAIYAVRFPDDPELDAWIEAHHKPGWKYRKLALTLRRGLR